MRTFIALLVLLTAVSAQAKTDVFVSILPQKYFLEKIAQDKININVMVLPGASPATYEPKPKQMVALSQAEAYFSIGVPFEKSWLPKFENLNKKMKMIRTDEGIHKLAMAKHVHESEEEHMEHDEHGHKEEHGHDDHEEDHDDHGHNDHGGIKDPHIWLDPILVKKQAVTITQALCDIDKLNCGLYTANNKKFQKELDELHEQLDHVFDHKERHFMVFHPSWGYLAKRYHLHQIPVELEGKEPKPSELRQFISLVKKKELKAIFVQPQFSRKAAKLIAQETGAKVVVADPLAENWAENLIYAAGLIAGR